MFVREEPFDHREIIDKSKVVEGLKTVGFSDNDADMVFDIAVNAANKAIESLRLGIEIADKPMIAVQAAIVGSQFLATGAQYHAEAMIAAVRDLGAKTMIQNEDGSIRSA